MKLIVGISGASGVTLAVTLLERLREQGVETHVVVSKNAETVLKVETGLSVDDIAKLASRYYNHDNLSAAISSGTFRMDGMVILPCSMKTLAGIAIGYSDNLLLRAADVTLKERRKLVLVPRESPLHAIHLENMLRLAKMGVTILMPLPAFYLRPQTVDQIIDHTVNQVLNLFGLECSLEEWKSE